MSKGWNATALTVLLGAVAVSPQLPLSAQATARSYTASRFGIELTAPQAAHLFAQSVTGGELASDVGKGTVAPGSIVKKQEIGVRFSPITLRGNALELLSAFQTAFDQRPVWFDGRIVTVDFNDKVLDQTTFLRAGITQIVLSALDASSRDAPTVELTLTPEQVRRSTDANGQSFPYTSKVQKAGPVLFELRMPGLDDAMKHVMRVESIRLLQRAPASVGGVSAEYAQRAPGGLETGNIVLTIPAAHAGELTQWRQQILAGRSSSLDKTLDLQLLTASKGLLLVLHASGVSLVNMREVSSPSSESRVQAELSVQHWNVGQGSTTALQ